MNYGYDSSCEGWKPERVDELIARLAELVKGASFAPTQGPRPYVEVNGVYGGVRVRRITHLRDLAAAVAQIDAAYDEAMGLSTRGTIQIG